MIGTWITLRNHLTVKPQSLGAGLVKWGNRFIKNPLILLVRMHHLLIIKEIPKVTFYYVFILNLNLKCIINFLKVISISKEYFT